MGKISQKDIVLNHLKNMEVYLLWNVMKYIE